MPLPADSPEFARLATRWLEGAATAAEAKQLFESVQADKACAKEFADQARFELLLQDTLREQLREQGIATGAREKTATYNRRATMRRALAIAAMLAFAGYLAWLVLPANRGQPAPETVQTPALPAPLPYPHSMPGNTMVLMARQDPAQPAANTPSDPLQKQLDQFFLTGIDLDKVPLSRALKMLEDQLRELNFANKAELAALHVLLPPGAGPQPVTFHSGSISFLKAVRALAALVGYDVTVDDTSVSLLARNDGNPMRQESRSVETLLTQLGSALDPGRNRLAELLNDARALGLSLDSQLDKDGNVTALQATPGQFEALSILTYNRDQIRSMPPLRFYMRANRSQQDAENHIYTGPEARQQRADFELATGAERPAPIIVPLLEFVPNGTMPPGVVRVVATPVGGDKVYLNINSGTSNEGPALPQRLANPPPSAKNPIVALVEATPQGGPGEVIKFTTSSNIDPSLTVLTSGPGGAINLGSATNVVSSSTTTFSGSSISSGGTLNFDSATGGGMTAETALQLLTKVGAASDGTVRTWTARILTVNGAITVSADSRAGLVTQLEFYRDTSPPP